MPRKCSCMIHMYVFTCVCMWDCGCECVWTHGGHSLMNGIFLSFLPLSMWMLGAECGFSTKATSALNLLQSPSRGQVPGGLTCLTSAWRCRSWRHCSSRLCVCSALSSSSCCFSWRNSSSSCTWAARSMSFSQINSIPGLKKMQTIKNQVAWQWQHCLNDVRELDFRNGSLPTSRSCS